MGNMFEIVFQFLGGIAIVGAFFGAFMAFGRNGGNGGGFEFLDDPVPVAGKDKGSEKTPALPEEQEKLSEDTEASSAEGQGEFDNQFPAEASSDSKSGSN